MLQYFERLESLPSLRDLARELGHPSHSTVQGHVETLVRDGYLVRSDSRLVIPISSVTIDYLRVLVTNLSTKINEYS